MKKLLITVGLALGIASIASAQSNQDPCISGGVETITTGKDFTAKWTMQQQQAASPTDPTLVPHRYNGFYLQVDGLPEVEIPLSAESGTCPQGSPRQGDKVYTTTVKGVQKGNHSLTILAWNWAPELNPDGTPKYNPDGTPIFSTTQRLRGQPAITPFPVVDANPPFMIGPPYGPWNTRVIKQ